MPKNRKKPKTSPEKLAVQVRFEPTPEPPFYYVNYMSVTHSAYDFTVSVAKVPSQLNQDQAQMAKKGQPLALEPVLQLIVPPGVAKALIIALTDQVNKYEDQFGKIITDAHENGKRK